MLIPTEVDESIIKEKKENVKRLKKNGFKYTPSCYPPDALEK
jgi:hypothetical protein